MGIITHPPFMANEKNVSSDVPVVVSGVASVVITCKIKDKLIFFVFIGEDIKKTWKIDV